jgi:hypothetical protein
LSSRSCIGLRELVSAPSSEHRDYDIPAEGRRGGGSGGSGSSGGNGVPTPGALANDAEKFVACMRSHGVANFPDPLISPGHVGISIGPSVVNSPHFKSAQAACQHLMPGKPTPVHFSAQQQADYLKAADCMRSHRIVGFPDPVFPSAGNVQFPLPAGMDANSAHFVAAREICQKLIPQGLPYSG